MNNSPTESTSPVAVISPDLSSVFIAFAYTGLDNGVPKSGFDSRVIKAPSDVQITSAEDIKSIADAIAQTEFQGGRKYVDLEITVLNVVRLPI